MSEVNTIGDLQFLVAREETDFVLAPEPIQVSRPVPEPASATDFTRRDFLSVISMAAGLAWVGALAEPVAADGPTSVDLATKKFKDLTPDEQNNIRSLLPPEGFPNDLIVGSILNTGLNTILERFVKLDNASVKTILDHANFRAQGTAKDNQDKHCVLVAYYALQELAKTMAISSGQVSASEFVGKNDAFTIQNIYVRDNANYKGQGISYAFEGKIKFLNNDEAHVMIISNPDPNKAGTVFYSRKNTLTVTKDFYNKLPEDKWQSAYNEVSNRWGKGCGGPPDGGLPATNPLAVPEQNASPAGEMHPAVQVGVNGLVPVAVVVGLGALSMALSRIRAAQAAV